MTRTTYFGEKARVYDARNAATDKRRREDAALREFIADISGTVLDIPVGTGHFLPLYKSLGMNVIGMDVSSEMMDQAKMKAPEIDFLYGDVLQIPLPDLSVDVAVCIRLLSLIDTHEMVLAIKELGRAASQAVIFSLKVGKEKVIKNRSITHPVSVFIDALRDAQLYFDNVRLVQPSNHFIYKVVK